MSETDKISIPNNWNYSTSTIALPIDQRIDPVKSELIALQRRRLQELTDQIEEDNMRQKNPTLQNAWDHYQMLLKLIKED